MVDPAGRTANSNGGSLEHVLASLLNHKGFVELSEKEKSTFRNSGGDVNTVGLHRWYARQVKLERTIYGGYMQSDFVVHDPINYRNCLHIECKWQSAQGSVDEKYVFTMLTLEGFERPSLFILAGPGARKDAIEWLRNRARASRPKGHVTFIYGMDAMQDYANKILTSAPK
jgi:hypothetical protein